MCQVLGHRGPDGEGVFADGSVALGHRRLSIIDLETGDQPMTNEDGQIWITFNGEIFNYRDLRHELIRAGHHFKTRSDTEVILHLYEDHDVDCLRHLNGQFAFGLWDGRKRRLLLARDRLGIKPLYFLLDRRRCLFGSELKAIREAFPEPRPLDLEALDLYLSYLYIPAPHTIFRGIQKLPASTALVVEPERFRLFTYWDLSTPAAPPREWAEALETQLQTAVARQMVSDVPVGAFLSGGIDSATVVAHMCRVSNPVNTFSIGFPQEEYSELPYARQVAERFGTRHHELVVDAEKASDLVPRLAAHLDEPFGDPSAVPTFHLARLAGAHVKVCLAGDGGDELFAGYDRYRDVLRHRVYDLLPRTMKRGCARLARMARPGSSLWKRFHRLGQTAWDRHIDTLTFFDSHQRVQLYTPELARAIGARDARGYLRALLDRYSSFPFLSQLLACDLRSSLAEDMLAKVDRMSMWNALEVRVPLLDHELVELAFQIPDGYKLRGPVAKWLLKQIMGEQLPPDILTRPKQGFGPPLKHWFKGDLGSFTAEILRQPRAVELGLFREEAVERLVDFSVRRRHIPGRRVWQLLILDLWLRVNERWIAGAGLAAQG
jgi:asparagine synthase (glutamine-hydrolysing)